MYKLTTIAIAAATALVWAAFPAAGDDTLKNKAERTGDKIENKAERAGDKIERAGDKLEDKADRAGDKIENKAERAKDKAENGKDTVGDKVDRAVDKTKAKAHEMKEKVSQKMDRGDTRNAQQALKAKGYDPGPIDGIHGPRTSAAIRDYQKAEGLKVTGDMNAETRTHLMGGSASATVPSASPTTSTAGSPSAAPVTDPQSVQRK
jgi:peptidoglycan hydrolase-like protein with peptidoglycan-binding domain